MEFVKKVEGTLSKTDDFLDEKRKHLNDFAPRTLNTSKLPQALMQCWATFIALRHF